MLLELILGPFFNFFYLFVLAGPIIGFYLLTAFFITVLKKDTSIGNFTWGGGVLLLTLFSFFIGKPTNIISREVLITILITIWAIRLAIYLYARYKKGADARFIKWSQDWGMVHIFKTFVWIVFMQGALMLIMSLPSVIVNSQALDSNLNVLDFLGLIIWIIGFFFESVGDYQLHTFLKNPKNAGKIMDQGLWKYTRHPNYFGEIAMWWGIYLIALSSIGGWESIIAPLTITILLVFVTGIPWAEGTLKNNPDYEAYKKRTNMLIPWFPKT